MFCNKMEKVLRVITGGPMKQQNYTGPNNEISEQKRQ